MENNKSFVIEKTYNAPVEKVWKAISDADEMRNWYFDLEEFRTEPGFKFEFTAGETPETAFLHRCVVSEAETNKKLKYSWEYPEYGDGVSYVTFELTPKGEQTILKLTHEGLDNFPQDNPAFAPENFAMGWTDIIGNHLKKYVEGK